MRLQHAADVLRLTAIAQAQDLSIWMMTAQSAYAVVAAQMGSLRSEGELSPSAQTPAKASATATTSRACANMRTDPSRIGTSCHQPLLCMMVVGGK